MMPSHLPPTENSKFVKPVTFRPEEARFSTIPIPTGSVTEAKMIGTVLVSFAKAVATGVLTARIRSGRLAAISLAAAMMRSRLAPAHSVSRRRFFPSLQPRSASDWEKASNRACPSLSLVGYGIRTAIRTCLPDCCGDAGDDHAAATPPTRRSPASFNHLVRAGEERRRDRETERLGGFQVYEKLEYGRLLNG